MGAAVLWGSVAAASLVIGAVLGIVRPWPDRLVGGVLAFGAGALISAVSYDLAEEGIRLGGGTAVAVGLAAGALTYFLADRALDRWTARRSASSGSSPGSSSGSSAEEAGPALALGAFLDGIPEQAVLGIGLAGGQGVSLGLLAAIFVSNLPEAIGSSTAMKKAGTGSGAILRLWLGVAVFCALATVAGYAIADSASPQLQAGIDGFAAGALLVMLTDSMIPEASRKAGLPSGLLTVLGFAVALALSLSE